MKALGTALQGQDTGAGRELYMALELSDKKWLLVIGDGRRAPSRHTVAAGATDEVLRALAKAKARCGLAGEGRVHSCYEAGRDGFWLHRWLEGQEIANVVVDAASIEVNRRARRTKTDRIDGEKLYTMLLRYRSGETRLWAVVRVPTAEQEDARRPVREAERLQREATAHRNRIGSLLVVQGLRGPQAGGRRWAPWWGRHAAQLLPEAQAEIEREVARLKMVTAPLKTLKARPASGAAGQAGGGHGAGAHGGAAAGGAGRDRERQRMAAGQGVAGLAAVSQSARGGRQCRPGRQPVQQRRRAGRTGHSQGRQQAGALAAGGAGVVLAALPDPTVSSRAGSTPASPTAASGCGGSASWRWHGGWRSRCGATLTRACCQPGRG